MHTCCFWKRVSGGAYIIKQCVVPKNIHTPPPPPTEGQWKFRGGGGLKGGNFRGVGGCPYEEFLQRVRKFTKKL